MSTLRSTQNGTKSRGRAGVPQGKQVSKMGSVKESEQYKGKASARRLFRQRDKKPTGNKPLETPKATSAGRTVRKGQRKGDQRGGDKKKRTAQTARINGKTAPETISRHTTGATHQNNRLGTPTPAQTATPWSTRALGKKGGTTKTPTTHTGRQEKLIKKLKRAARKEPVGKRPLLSRIPKVERRGTAKRGTSR